MSESEFIVYVVDNRKDSRESLQFLLESHSFHVEAFSSGSGFLEDLPEKPVGCAVLDVRMPGMDGFEVHEELKRRLVKLPVMYMTAFESQVNEDRGRTLGAVGYYRKPLENDDLIKQIKTIYEQQNSSTE